MNRLFKVGISLMMAVVVGLWAEENVIKEGFLNKLKSKNGVNRKIIIEVKPAKETVLPKKPKRMTKKSKVRYLNECMTYQKNSDKWESATAYAKKNGMEFKIMTEYDIYGQKGK